MKYFQNLKEIYYMGNIKFDIDNWIGDEGCRAIFKNARYLTNVEKLYLHCN